MTGIVVDASVIHGWFLPSQATEVSESAWRLARTSQMTAPSHLIVEVSSGLRKLERRGLIEASKVDTDLGRLQAIGIELDTRYPTELMAVWMTLSRRSGLSIPDAAYLELALHRGFALATRDQALRSAAGRAEVELVR